MQKQSLDREWRFHLGDSPEWRWRSSQDDAGWQVVDLPHDWSIELTTDPANPSGSAGGYFPMGLGWYRKTLPAPEEWRGKKVFVEFEGVYMNAEVWLDDNFLGRHPYGYTAFQYDLTPYLNYGGQHTLRVLVDNSCQLNSRWYSGSGIYRHVWLLVADPIHVDHWGVSVTTPEVNIDSATVSIHTTVLNESRAAQEVALRTRVITPDGVVAGIVEERAGVRPGGRHVYTQEVPVTAPRLWSPEAPHLYRLETEALSGGSIVDTATTLFGIRSLHVDATRGFLLNGRPLKLKGGCVHHDNGVLGAASFDRSEERKVELLRASGYNAIRCAHNPPAPAFLDACDRLGMLVIDEAFDCWRDGKNLHDYHVAFDDWWRRDMDSMLLRDRNHPSVVMWSIGNELVERDGRSGGAEIARMLAEHVHAVDPTRPVTAAICGIWNGGRSWESTDGVFAALDVGGYNYQQKVYVSDHERHPDRVICGLESTPREAFEHWTSVQESNYVIGDFVWTSLDYLGEAGIGRVHFDGDKAPGLGAYPWHQANCGDLDLCGFKRPQSYYRDVLWQTGSQLYIAVHAPVPEGQTPTITYWGWPDVAPNWTWPGHEDQTFAVDVYSACEKVELFLNDESLGVRPSGRAERFTASFEVPYRPGVLRAAGYVDDRVVAEHVLEIAGEPACIRLTPDRATIEATGDLCFVTVEVVDHAGRLHPNAAHEITFSLSGEGALAAVGSADPVSTESYVGDRRRVYHGRCLAVVKSQGVPGEIRLAAQAEGLEGAEILIKAA